MVQYIPQLAHTYSIKLVGALSIPTMLIQTPGSVLITASIVIRYVSFILSSLCSRLCRVIPPIALPSPAIFQTLSNIWTTVNLLRRRLVLDDY
jgi:hypothetical protein